MKLSPADLAVIEDWLAKRRALLEARDVDDILRAVDHMNLTTQWWSRRPATPSWKR